jgi:hypothetical protein
MLISIATFFYPHLPSLASFSETGGAPVQKFVAERTNRSPCPNRPLFFFESYGFIHVHIVIILMKFIVLNDSICGYIHIIREVFLFLVTPPLPSYCCIYFGTEL